MLSLFGRWITTTVDNFLSSKHPLLYHSTSWKFTYPCRPSQRIHTSSAVQTLVSLPGNNWSVDWTCRPASLCHLLYFISLRRLGSLSLRSWRRFHYRLCIVWSVFVNGYCYQRGPTSRSAVGAEIQTSCYFEAHAYHSRHVLDCIQYFCFLLRSRSPDILLV